MFFDDTQLPQGRSYVTRVKVAKGKDADQWLSVPVQRQGLQRICNVKFAEDWAEKHLRTLHHVYAKARQFDAGMDLVRPVFSDPGPLPVDFNMRLIERIARYLGWTGTFHRSSDHPADLKADARIAQLVEAIGGDIYVSGAGGQRYQHEDVFAARGINLEVYVYTPVPYERSGWPFVPGLSVLDAIFHLGTGAREVLAYARESA